ncbi:MAG: leucine-rich repeat protein [Muribaculaceae bacterium]|nr:leucine-rich repeat protein [Muribaculaceae bacterium]
MKRFRGIYISATLLTTLVTSCQDNDNVFDVKTERSDIKINLTGQIVQDYKSRVNDNGFCNGDKVGIYVVNYDGNTPGLLQAKDNEADNVGHVYDETTGKWNAAYDIFFRDDKTKVDIYGYYPYASPTEINSYSFELTKDQSTGAADGRLGGYEASDFLWAKASAVSPTDRVIPLSFHHVMASARVTLVEGTGFDDGEWARVEKQVIMMNTVRTCNINLAAGEVTATGSVPSTGTIPYEYNGDYRSIIVPQTVEAGKVVAVVTVGGTPYNLTKDENMVYYTGKQHNFTITVNKRIGSGYEFVLTSESITVWENDNVSHDATPREYVVINVEQPGTLAECVRSSGKELSEIKNLKITGQINEYDLKQTVRADMTKLSALNLKEAKVWADGREDVLGYGVLNNKTTLTSIVLPDRLKIIDNSAFESCNNLTGSLIIPEGVEEIRQQAFFSCSNLTGTLSLPSTLKKIGQFAFCGCKFISELKLPEGLTELGQSAFSSCSGLYGELKLPENLKKLGSAVFSSCKGFTGSLTIPQGITEIPNECFSGCTFGGTLSLHNGITTIGANAFYDCLFKGELQLPKELEIISTGAFAYNNFSGTLVIPDNVIRIGNEAFRLNQRLVNTIEFPQSLLSIGQQAFDGCNQLQGIVLPKNLESVGEEAFRDCFMIGSIVCKGDNPALVVSGAFNGVAKDNFTLEVPESAILAYQTTSGWSDFKRIAAHRELVCRPAFATAINTAVSRDLVLNAESDWEVVSKPDWVSLNKTSGTGRTELKLTIHEMSHGADKREGEVVFRLIGKDYTTTCRVTQYDYEYNEDQMVTLQKATRGKGVNLVFLGDGYSAKDVSEGKLLRNINEGVEHFFNIEPYKTYRNYFNVYTGISVSQESGVGTVNTIINNRFNTTSKNGVTLGGRNSDGSDYEAIFRYACKAPTISDSNLGETLIVMVLNSPDYGGITYLYSDVSAIAYCPMIEDEYPYDFRGIVQHEAGGHGFAKLGDEYIYHNAFIDDCGCPCCDHDGVANAKKNGWFENLSLTGKINAVPWSHFIYHEKYRQVVDIFEGGYMHTRGVFRSEQNSCMNNNIPYYSAISRETMVKRIKAIAGEPYSFEDFVANDVMDASTVATRSLGQNYGSRTTVHNEPVFMGRRPRINK